MLCRWRSVRSLLIEHRRGISSESLMQSVRGVLNGDGDGGSSSSSVESLRKLLFDGEAGGGRRRRHRTSPPPTLPSEVAAALTSAYDAHRADPAARLRFFRLLSEGFGLRAADDDDDDSVARAYEVFRRQRDAGQSTGGGGGHDAAALARAAARLRDAATPPYMRLLMPVAHQSGGIAWLVRLRGDLLEALHASPTSSSSPLPPSTAAAAPALRVLAEDLRGALSCWFSPGLLTLRTLDWSATPAGLLDRAARADRVHPMASLEDLRPRLDRPDRRVFAFEHPSTPGDPLVVLHTALFPAAPGGDADAAASVADADADDDDAAADAATDAAADAAVPSRIEQILGAPPPPPPSSSSSSSPSLPPPPPPAVACFYSISSDNAGLAGVDLGNYLIKQAARRLKAEFPSSLRRLATLSPIPLMRATVEQRLAQLAAAPPEAGKEEEEEAPPALAALRRLLTSGDVPARLERARRALGLERPPLPAGSAAAAAADLSALFGGPGGGDPWLSRAAEHGDPALFDDVLLPRLAAVYLTLERRRGRALDPVAGFHFSNGALVWRVCPLADRKTPKALACSFGCLANYWYALDERTLHERSSRYLVEREVARGASVEALLRGLC